MNYPQTILYRHRRENLKKCSLQGLEGKSEFHFLTYPIHGLPPLNDYILLKVGAPVLSPDDQNKGLLLLDATWRLAEIMEKTIPETVQARSLPTHFRTAYPRRQTHCPDPQTGLASIEALFLSYLCMNRPTNGILDHYHWKDAFLKINNI